MVILGLLSVILDLFSVILRLLFREMFFCNRKKTVTLILCFEDKLVAHVVAAGFLSHYLNGPLPYVLRHINKVCVSLNKTFPSFLDI